MVNQTPLRKRVHVKNGKSNTTSKSIIDYLRFILLIIRNPVLISLLWRHNGLHCVSNHQPHECLLNRSFGHRSKKTSKLRVTGLCVGNSPETSEFPAQRDSNAENVFIWWRLHVGVLLLAACHEIRIPESIYRPSFPGMDIPMLKIRRSPILVRRHLYTETAPTRWVTHSPTVGKIQCPAPDIYVKNVHFDWINRYVYAREHFQSDLHIFRFDLMLMKPHDVPPMFCFIV